MENDDELRFHAETSEEAHYWFVVSDFVRLTLDYGIDKVLKDMIELRAKRLGDL